MWKFVFSTMIDVCPENVKQKRQYARILYANSTSINTIKKIRFPYLQKNMLQSCTLYDTMCIQVEEREESTVQPRSGEIHIKQEVYL